MQGHYFNQRSAESVANFPPRLSRSHSQCSQREENQWYVCCRFEMMGMSKLDATPFN